ncbi:MAG: response regulator [Kiritimatiellae bacterium]|nr:response regulator [Kiritimatiellia bacterium]MDD5523344.1 response regulator [Kiritimatiellia bacterium]
MSKILIVDDDHELIEATTAVLEEQGHSVISAVSGTEGFTMAKMEKPDLILLDVMMENDSAGFEIARALKEDNATKNMPVIIITGIRKAKNLPFKFEPDEDWLPVKAVLEKPVAPEILIEAVDKALKG